MTRKHKKKKEAEEERQENQNKAADPEYVREKKKGVLQLNFRYTHQMLTFKNPLTVGCIRIYTPTPAALTKLVVIQHLCVSGESD